MDQALEWIVFNLEAHRRSIIEEGFDNFFDLSSNSIKDISDLAYKFIKRTVAGGRITFRLRQTKPIEAMMHWLMGFQRCSEQPTIAPLNQLTFLQALETASSWEDIITQESEQADIISKLADPGKFKDERKCNYWDVGIMNYLSTIHSALRVPLSYVIRENVDPIPEGHDNFIEKSIACAPLSKDLLRSRISLKMHL